MNITIKSEFETLIPPLSPDEFQQLEENVLSEGIREPLIVWNGVLIDGHNRYRIAQKHGLPFRTSEMDFESENDAIIWIIKNQFGRRNLSKYDRSVLALRLKPAIAEKAKKNQIRKSVSQNSVKQKPIDTQRELAKIAGVSHDTIHKVEVIEAKADEDLKNKIRSGNTSINDAFTRVTLKDKKPKQEAKEAKARHEEFQRIKAESNTVDFQDIQKDARDVRTIGRDFFDRIEKITFKVHELTLFRDDTDIDAAVKTYSASERAELGRNIDKAITILQFLKRRIAQSV